MASWRALADEAMRWSDSGRKGVVWWRDDDAVDASPALDRLLTIQQACAVPLSLAVVPAQATPALAARLRELHSYELPEIIAVDVSVADPAYQAWVESQVKPD